MFSRRSRSPTTMQSGNVFRPQVILGRVLFNFPRCCFAASIARLCLSRYYVNVFKLLAEIVLDYFSGP